jgi:hypothetical protein
VLAQVRHDRRTRPAAAAFLIGVSLLVLRIDHRRVENAEAMWYPATTAWIAATDLDAGHLLGADDVVSRRLPPIALPVDAVADAPVGKRLADAIGAGEIIRGGRLRGGDGALSGSLVGSGRGALALTTAAPHLEVGDRVDLYGLFTGALVAAGAEVISLVDDAPVVAVSTSEVSAVVRALATGEVVPVVVR